MYFCDKYILTKKYLTKENFEIYWLLFVATSYFNIPKVELIKIVAEVDRDTFINVYNHFESDKDIERTSTLMNSKKRFHLMILKEWLLSMK